MPADDLRRIAEDYWDIVLEASPTTATILGDHRFDDRIEDLSAGGEAELRQKLLARQHELAGLDEEGLAGDDRVTYSQLSRELTDALVAIDQRLTELQSDQMTSFHVGLLQSMPVMRVSEPDQAEAIVERYRQIPTALEQAVQRFRAGLQASRTPARICIERSINMVDGYLASSLDDDVFANIVGPQGWDGEVVWRQLLTDVTRDAIRPAYQRLRYALAEYLLPAARTDAHCGLSWLPDGPDIYATLVGHHTTLELSPEDIHAVGLEQLTERLPMEYASVGGRLFAITEVAAIFDRLRNDKSLRYERGDEIMADARRSLAAATAAIPGWFGRLPASSCQIEEVPDFLAADSPVAYYYPPAADGARPGTYYVNTHDPGERNRYEAAAVGFHEAIPGHHLQLAIANELTQLPRFRRQSLTNTAYVEGWGLYAERLADEMGLYQDDLERLGMLTADSLRACRLVVDTGLHSLQWSRQEAIDFMASHTPVSVEEVTVEVDRYIAMPGQALAYKLGQREIFRIRDDARSRLGARFDIKAFHDTILGCGPVMLPVLAEVIHGWATRLEQPSEKD
jgi:uncharacterized protein (DUF885 family)